ncbi:MAG: DUF3472 domain-containing protein [Planctomycetia bacterium]
MEPVCPLQRPLDRHARTRRCGLRSRCDGRWLIVVWLCTLAPLFVQGGDPPAADGAEWTVPFGGNAYEVASKPGSNDGLERGGAEVRWHDPETTWSVWFHIDRSADAAVELVSAETGGRAEVELTLGDTAVTAELSGDDRGSAPFGTFPLVGPGYIKAEIRGVRREGGAFASAPVLRIRSETPELVVTAVTTNDGAMFYWGRRGPSVHLGYSLPAEKEIEYAYGEVTVPEGEDALGSFFMANGFGEGYFGMQVNGPAERRVLFSVWSPFTTDDPTKVPEADRVALLRKGEGVRTGEFGNEGSGGQSFLVHPWKAGLTYRFLTRVEPAGDGTTTYTSWFGEGDAWRLIASFRRPRTDRHLTGFHSFLENFLDTTGNVGRRARYANQWVRDTEGTWHPISTARFTGDATASGGHRLDYAGGLEGDGFFLRNCGFFSPPVKLGSVFTLDPPPAKRPAIDLEALP